MMSLDRGWWSYLSYDDQRDRPSVNRAVLRRVATYARPYAWRVVVMLATIVAITLLSLVPPLLIRQLIDHALPFGDFAQLHLLALGMVVVPVFSGLLGVWQRYLGSRIGEGIIYDLRKAIYGHMQRMSLRFFTESKTGELMARLNSDVVGAQQAVTSTLVNIASNLIAVVAALAVMLTLEWRLTVVGVLLLPLFVLPARQVGQVLRGVTRESMGLNAQMNSLMNETLNVSGALLVKLFGKERAETERFGERAERVRDIGIRSALIGRWFFLGLSLVSAVGTAVVFWIGGYFVLTESLTIGTVVAFGAYLGQLYGPLSALTNARVEFATSLVSFERVFEVLDLPVEIAQSPHAVTLDEVQGRVQFEHVWFSYGELPPASLPAKLAEVNRGRRGTSSDVPLSGPRSPQAAGTVTPAETRWALRDVTFDVAPGQLVALVGPSGAGKTTLTYLLPRLYDPTQGQVLLDGYDLREVALESLVQQVGMVTQEAYLFHDSIRANLLYANPDASDSMLEDACRSANIYDFISSLPDRFETVVGERGYRLSGGEKQRLAIARVILKNPRILILDEATAHLDSNSEAQVQVALSRVMKGRTSLVIAHRLSTVLAADCILVLEQGQIVERGTHPELIARSGLYAQLYETQFRAALVPALPVEAVLS
ncbi:MAG: ABC transporter ATP-binding protein [Chloroflexota bacterium]